MNTAMLRAVMLFALLLSASNVCALVCAVPGSSGPGTVTGVVNSYYPGRSSAPAGSTSIPVGTPDARGSATAITAGDLLLVIQMQDATINSSNSSSYGGSSPGQGYTSINSAGAFEYVTAAGAVSAGSVPITSALLNGYTQASASSFQGQRTFQVIRVPQYSSATITGTVTAPVWNGSTGGIVAFDVAGNLNWGGQTIDVNGRGFRGGAQKSRSNGTGDALTNIDYVTRVGAGTLNLNSTTAGSVPNGTKGEGVAGTPIIVFVPTTPNNDNVAGTVTNTGGTDGSSGGYPGGSFARGAPGNAGGGGTDGDPPANDQNTGGGGGGNYGVGGTGGFGWTPGTPPGSQTGGFGGGSVPGATSRLFFGGGGGTGVTNDGTSDGTGIFSSGASGGGIVLVRTGSVTGSGTINANGANANILAVPPGSANGGVANDASGGAGAGGSVLVFVDNGGGSIGATINVNGGHGGNNAPGVGVNPHGPGGGGGGGYAVLSGPPVAISYNGGANGITSTSAYTTSDYGSTTSPGGFQMVNLGATQIPGAGASPECYPRITASKTTSTPDVNQGGIVAYVITATNQSGYGTASGLNISDTLPNNPNFTYAATTSIVLAGGATRTVVSNPAAGALVPAWGTFSIPGGGSVTTTFTVNVNPATPLVTYQNPASVSYDDPTATAAGQKVTPGGSYAGGGTVLGSNYIAASSTGEDVTVHAPATFSKSFNPTSIGTGGTSVMTVAIGNPSGIPLTNAGFSDTYPAGLVNAAVPNVSTTCTGGTVSAAPTGTSFSLSGTTIPPAGCQVLVTVASPISGPFTNTIPVGALSDNENITNTSAGTGTLLARPTIAKSFSPIAVATNTNDTLTFTITNPNATGLTNIAFSDSYPAGLVNATPLTTGGSCTGVALSGTTVAGGSLFNVTAGNVPASGSCTITVQVRAASAGNFPNTTGGVTSTQTPDAGPPSATMSLGVGLIVVNKAFAPAQIAPGGTSTVTLTLNNPTGIAQTNGSLTDTLTNMSISANQTAGGSCGAFSGNGLTAGQSSLAFSGINIPAVGCTITFVVTSNTTGSNQNTTSGVTTALLPLGPASNSATLTVAQKPTIAKAFVPASFPPGGSGSMVLTITNPDSIPLTGINFTDSYPANLVNGLPLTLGGTCGGITVSGATVAGGSVFNATSGTVPALSSCTITVPVTSSVAGTYNNATSGVATTETGAAGTASNTATLNVVVPPAVTAKSFAPSLISQNGVSTMTVTLQNSNAVPLTNVNFSDVLTNMTVANSTIGGSCVGTSSSPALVAGATSLNLSVPTIAAGTSCTVTIQITSNVSGANTNQTSGATSTQTPVAGSPSPVATLNVLRPPQLAKNFVPGQITVGGTATLSFTISNQNATTALNNVQFSDALSNMTLASASFSKTCSGSVSFSPALAVGGTQVNPILTTLNANETCTVSVTVTSGTISPATGLINTTSGATSTETSINPGAPAFASLNVLGPVTIAKVFSPATIQTGATSTITFTLTNPNASAMTGAAFTDVFPPGLTTTNVSQTYTGGARGTCTGAIPNAKITTTYDDSPNSGATPKGIIASINIPASGSCTVMVDVTAAASGSYVNTVSGVTTTQVPAAGPAASATLTVLAAPTITKAFSPTTIASGSNSTLTVSITNPNAATISLTSLFTDTFPAGMTINTAGNSGTCAGVTANAGAGSFTIANGTSIPAGGCTVIIDVTSSTVGTATNTIAAGALQTNAGNNAVASGALTIVAAGTNRLIYTKSFSQSQVQAGPANANLNMIFTISNLSAGTNATRVRFNSTDVMAIAGGARMLLVNGTNSCTITASIPANGCISNGTTGVGATVVNALASTAQINFQNANSGLQVNAGAVCTVTCPATIPAATTGGNYTNTADYLITQTNGFTNTTGSSDSVLALKSPTITKAFAPNVIGAGSISSITFTLNNASNSIALSNATFTDTLTNMNISGDQTAGGTCSGAASNSFTNGQAGLLTLTGLTLPASGSCTVTLVVTSTNVAINANTTSGVTTTQTPTAGTGAASVNLTVRGTTLTKAFAPATVLTGVPSTLTFTIANGTGNPAQSGLAFTETLPANVVVASPANASTTCGGGTVTAGSGSNSIVLSNGSMALAQATCTVTADVISNTAGSYSNLAANVTGTSPGMTNSANATLTVSNHPVLTKAYAPATIGPGGTSTLTFTVANSTGNPAQSNLAFTDNLPAGLTVTAVGAVTGTGCSGTPSYTASTVSLAAGAITVGNGPCTFTATVRGDAAGSYPNTNVGNISGLGGGLTADALTSTLAVVGTTLSKSFSPATQMLGSNSQVTLTITNGAGNPAQSGLAFTDTLPAGLVISTPAGLVNGCGGTATVTAGSSTISLAGGALSGGTASCSITVNTIASAVGVYTNNAARISGTSANIDASGVSAVVTYLAPAGISKAFAPNTITSDAPSTITFTLGNANSITLTNATFTDTLGGMAFNANQTAGGSCAGAAGNSFANGQTSLTFSGLTVPLNGSCTVTVLITSNVVGTQTNQASGVSSSQAPTGPSSNSANLVVQSIPTLTKAFSSGTIGVNQTATLTFTITNPAGALARTGLTFTDTFPANLVIAPAPTVVNGCGGTPTITANAGAGIFTVEGTGVNAAAGASTCTISVKVTSSVPLAGYVNGAAQITAISGLLNGVTAQTLNVYSAPSIAKSFAAPNVALNGSVNMSFLVSNPNATGVTGIALSDTLPAGLTATNGSTATCGGSMVITGSNLLTFSGGTLAASPATCTITVPVTGTVAGAKNNTSGVISSTESGSGVASNTATVTVLAPPTIAKAFGAPTIGVGATTSLNLTVTNPNAGTALSGIAFTDTLPAGLTAVNGSTATCGGNLVITGTNLLTFTGGSLAAGTNCVISTTVTGATAGVKNNTTTAVSASGPVALTGLVSNTTSVTVSSVPTIAKSFAVANVALNGSVNMSFLISNPNTTGVTGIAFSDTLPAGLTATNGSTATCGGSLVITGSNLLAFSGGTLAGSGTCTITVPVTGTVAGVKNNTSGVISSTESGSGAASNTATLNVYAPPTVTKSFTPASISSGGTSSMVITVTNPGANPGNLTGVSISDTYAGTLKNNAAGSVVCSGGSSATLTGGVNNGTTVGFNAGTIVPGGTCTITQSVTATATVNNSTGAPTASGPAALTGTAAGPVTLTVNALPIIAKAFSPASVDVYSTSIMTFTLNNPNGTALTSARFTDTLTGFSVAAPATLGGTCVGVVSSPALVAGATALDLTVPNLPSGSCTITIPVSASAAGSYPNVTSGITTVETGATAGSASNTATLSVNFQALQVTKTPSVFTATPGSLISYVIGYGNPNASTWLQNVVITDPVPPYTRFQSAVCGPLPPGITTCTITAPAVGGTGTVTWTLGGTLNAGSSGTVTLTVKVD